MSSVPKPDKKPKYNNNEAFAWVDSQWEKFMTEQKEHKAMIKQLQKDLGTCTENFQNQRKKINELEDKLINYGHAPTDGLEVGSPEDYE